MGRTGFLGGAAALALAACASSPPKPPTPAEMLLGTWQCQSQLGAMGAIKGTTTYKPAGAASFKLEVAGSGNGMAIEAAGEGDATWQLLENDTKLQTTLGAVTITSAKLNGNVVDPALAQGLLGASLAGQSATSALEITPATMKLTTADGAVTNCTR